MCVVVATLSSTPRRMLTRLHSRLAVGCDLISMSGQLNNPAYLAKFKHPSADLQGGIVSSMAAGASTARAFPPAPAPLCPDYRSASAGSFGGSLLTSWLADKIGRKRCIILSGYLWVVGCIIQAAANNVECLVAGRVVGGIAVSPISLARTGLALTSKRERAGRHRLEYRHDLPGRDHQA